MLTTGTLPPLLGRCSPDPEPSASGRARAPHGVQVYSVNDRKGLTP